MEPNHVFVAQHDPAAYKVSMRVKAPELPAGAVNTTVWVLRNLMKDAGLDAARHGTDQWNPLGDLIQQGDKVLLKPNWVMGENGLR